MVDEFELIRISLFDTGEITLENNSAAIAFCTKGASVLITDKNQGELGLKSGDSVFIAGSVKHFTLIGDGDIFVARIPK